MSKKIHVDVETVQTWLAYQRSVNDRAFNDIVWYRNGKPMNITQQQLDEWKMISLNNIAFAELVLLKEQSG